MTRLPGPERGKEHGIAAVGQEQQEQDDGIADRDNRCGPEQDTV